jgi:signal transduction histidine kinase
VYPGKSAGGEKTWHLGREIVVSRVVGAVAAVCLLAATAQAMVPGPWQASHPRNWVVAIGFSLLGLRVVAHTRRNAVGWLFLVIGLCSALTVGAEAWSGLRLTAWVGNWIWWPSYALIPVIALLFPDGKPLSRGWRVAVVLGLAGVVLPMVGLGLASWSSPATFWGDAINGTAPRGLPVLLAVTGVAFAAATVVCAVVAQVVRWRRTDKEHRLLLVWAIVCTVLVAFAVGLEQVHSAWGAGAWAVGAAAFPIATVIAIVRYGFYDIGLLIHRSVLYGLIATGLVAVYSIVVLVAVSPFPEQAQMIGTVAVALAFAPLYRVLRGGLDRWLYGSRADPYTALSRLGRQLENPLGPDDVFPTVAKSVSEALKLPYVAVYLGANRASQPRAEHGTSRDRPQEAIAMTYRGEQVGELVVEARSPEEPLGRHELRLLDALARQAAPSARAALLGEDLRRAEERALRDRKENMREIMREFHDGIGPSLRGIHMQVRAATQGLLESNSEVRGQLESALSDIETTLAEVRELPNRIYPRELYAGLQDALRRQAEQFHSPDLAVEVVADGELGTLPAAVEHAAYVITRLALANVAEHSQAKSCTILLRRNDDLELEIADDGRGLPENVVWGVGLASMRERCVELGGTCAIQQVKPHGTKVIARLPIEATDQLGMSRNSRAAGTRDIP